MGRQALGPGRGPAGEQPQGLLGRRAGLGGVDREGEAGLCGQLQPLVGQGQLADQVLEVLVVGVAAGLGAQDGHGDVGEEVPVRVEPAGALVEEGEPGEVGGPLGVGVDVGVERPGEPVDRQQVHAAIADEGGPVGDRVQGPLQARSRDPGQGTSLQLGAPRDEELPGFGAMVHARSLRRRPRLWGALPVHLPAGTSSPSQPAVSWTP
jgi:hypothetical protein